MTCLNRIHQHKVKSMGIATLNATIIALNNKPSLKTLFR